MYSPTFWDHVRHPRNNRTLSDALVGEARFHRCGDRLTLYLKVDNQKRITEATFCAKACAPVIAVASMATESLVDKQAEEALHLNIFEMDRELGGIPASKRHAFLIFIECLHDALQHFKQLGPIP